MRATVPPGAKAASMVAWSGATSAPCSSAASSRGRKGLSPTSALRTALSEKGSPPCSAARCARTGRYDHSTSGCMLAKCPRRPRGRSARAHRMTRHMPIRASTSSPALCVTGATPNACAISARRCVVRRGSAMRLSARVSIHVSVTSWPPGTASMNVRSKDALCASTGMPPTKSASPATASRGEGALITSRSLMPVRRVISAGMGRPGCTKVS